MAESFEPRATCSAHPFPQVAAFLPEHKTGFGAGWLIAPLTQHLNSIKI
jgi:hypothetical protein